MSSLRCTVLESLGSNYRKCGGAPLSRGEIRAICAICESSRAQSNPRFQTRSKKLNSKDKNYIYHVFVVFQELLVAESSRDEIDAVRPTLASSDNTAQDQMSQVQVNVAMIQLVDLSPSAPAVVNVEASYSEASSSAKLPCQKSLSTTLQTVVTDSKREVPNAAFKEVKPFTELQLTSLYQNQELSLVDAFVTEFTETQLRCAPLRQQHRLHELLMNYLRVRNHFIANSYELERLKKNCRETQKQLWCLEKTSVTENGECQDGNPVSATHEYSIAHFNQQTLVALSRTLSAIKETLHDSQALYCYEAESLRLQIEHYVQRVARSFNVSRQCNRTR